MVAHARLPGLSSRLAVVYWWPAKSAADGDSHCASLCCPVTARVRKLTDVPAVADDSAQGRVAARRGLSLQSAGAVLQGRCALAVPAHLEIPTIRYAAEAATCLITQHTHIHFPEQALRFQCALFPSGSHVVQRTSIQQPFAMAQQQELCCAAGRA